MLASPLSRLAHTAPDRPALPAGADRPEADPAQNIDAQPVILGPDPDGNHADVMLGDEVLHVTPKLRR